jgi:hypothetical protein
MLSFNPCFLISQILISSDTDPMVIRSLSAYYFLSLLLTK